MLLVSIGLYMSFYQSLHCPNRLRAAHPPRIDVEDFLHNVPTSEGARNTSWYYTSGLHIAGANKSQAGKLHQQDIYIVPGIPV